MINIIKILVFVAMIFELSSCVPLAVGAGTVVVGSSAIEERTVGGNVDDKALWSKIRLAFMKQPDTRKIFFKISIKVLEGKVLVTGDVQSDNDKLLILKTIWSQNGVKEVINEVKVTDSKIQIGVIAKDTWITSQVKTKLLFNKNIKSVNYSIETMEGIVYIFGIAQNEHELDEVTRIASNVSDVERVVTYVRFKDARDNFRR